MYNTTLEISKYMFKSSLTANFFNIIVFVRDEFKPRQAFGSNLNIQKHEYKDVWEEKKDKKKKKDQKKKKHSNKQNYNNNNNKKPPQELAERYKDHMWFWK